MLANNSWRAWIIAMRPKTLSASIAPVLGGAAISWEDHAIQVLLTSILAFYAVSLQILSNLVNDYWDYRRGIDTPQRVGPIRACNSGLITSEQMRRAIIINIIVILLLGAYLSLQTTLWVMPVTLIGIASAYCYSGGSRPYGSLGLGELFVFIFFGPVMVLGSYYLLAQKFSLDALVLGTSLGLISCALLVANNIRDYEQDLAANKKTLVVRYGKCFGKFEYLILILLAGMTPWLDRHLLIMHPYSLISSAIIVVSAPALLVIFKHQDPAEINSVMKKTAIYIVFFGLVFATGFLLGRI